MRAFEASTLSFGICFLLSCCLLSSISIVKAQFDFGSTVYPVGQDPIDIVNADLNGDSAFDLVVLNFDDSNLSVLMNDGTGHFVAGPNLNLGFEQSLFAPSRIAAGDFNNDGLDDVAVVRPMLEDFFADGLVLIYTSNGDGTFGSPVDYELGRLPVETTTADLDHDGDEDLLVTNVESDQLSVLMNDDNGLLHQPTFVNTEENPGEVVCGDVNGDKIVDVIVMSPPTNFFCVFIGNGDGTFEQPEYFLAGSGVAFSIDLGDIDGDSDLDLIDGSTTFIIVSISRNNGLGDFTVDFNNMLNILPAAVRLIDIDGDGLSEMIILTGSNINIYPNDAGEFGNPQFLEIGSTAFAVQSGDYNLDGKTDLVSASATGNTITVFLQGSSILLGDVNQDGNIDLLDVAPFVELLVNGQFQIEADINSDGGVDLLDVALFVELLN